MAGVAVHAADTATAAAAAAAATTTTAAPVAACAAIAAATASTIPETATRAQGKSYCTIFSVEFVSANFQTRSLKDFFLFNCYESFCECICIS